jgi:transcriptional regulator with XRE-family HTH domain
MLRIAGNIERIRNEKKLTQEDMEARGFSLRWFQRIESGKYSVSLPTLDHLARKLGVDIVELFRSL